MSSHLLGTFLYYYFFLPLSTLFLKIVKKLIATDLLLKKSPNAGVLYFYFFFAIFLLF